MEAKRSLTFKQKILLILGVPTTLLVVIELVSQAVLLLGTLESKPTASAPTQLEMPTWMMQDANSLARSAPTADSLAWLSLFVEGDGFRVKMIPNTSRLVKNTFSLIPQDGNKEYLISSNAAGFRGPELPPVKAPDTYRIAVFGDSSSFGWGVNYEDSWSGLLQGQLQASLQHKKIEVVNFAVPGDSSAYGRLLFDRYAPQSNPDLVVLGFGANDAKDVLTSHTSQVERFEKKKGLVKLAGLLKYSATYRILEKVITKLQKKAALTQKRDLSRRVQAVTPSEYANNLRLMVDDAGNMKAKTMLLALCTPNSYARVARGVAREKKALWLNGQTQLLKALPEIESGEIFPELVAEMKSEYPEALVKNRLFYVTSDGCHPNKLGHRFVAGKIAGVLGDKIRE